MNLSTNERVQGWCLMLLVAAVLQLVAYTEEFAFFITLFFFSLLLFCCFVLLFSVWYACYNSLPDFIFKHTQHIK